VGVQFGTAAQQEGGGRGPGVTVEGSEQPRTSRGQQSKAGGVGSHEIGEVGALTGGPRALCRVLNRFKLSKSIQTC
jgi:chemotaxis response regulator CheB